MQKYKTNKKSNLQRKLKHDLNMVRMKVHELFPKRTIDTVLKVVNEVEEFQISAAAPFTLF